MNGNRKGISMNLAARVVVCVLSVCVVEAHVMSQGAADPWFGRSVKPRDFEVPRLPWNTFTIELPKGWQLLPGHNGMLLTAAEKTRTEQPAAVIMLEQMRLQDSVLPKDLSDATLSFEAASTKERDPANQNFQQQIKTVPDGRRYIFIQYTRPGLYGPDRVTQYSVPAGLTLYRVICIAPEAQIAKYQPTCAHVADSFKTTTAAGVKH
jgi:hypothetical protein